MVDKWNPSHPLRIGLEWDALRRVEEPIDFAREVGLVVVPTATVTVTGANVHMPNPPVGNAFVDWMLVTVYEAGHETDTGEPFQAGPAAVTAGTTTGALVGTATVVDALSEPFDSKFITLDPNEHVTVSVGSAGLASVGERILNVGFLMQVTPPVTGSTLFEATYLIGGLETRIAEFTVDAGTGNTTYTLHTGEIFLGGYNYAAVPTEDRLRVWLRSDLTNLSNGTVQFRVKNLAGADQQTASVNWIGTTVTLCRESRVASGGLIRAAIASLPWVPGWQESFQLWDPSAQVVGAQLVAGRSYTVTATRATDMSCTNERRLVTPNRAWQLGDARTMSTLEPTTSDVIRGVEWQRLTDGRLTGVARDINRGAAIVLLNSVGAGVQSVSNPYAVIDRVSVADTEQRVRTDVTATYTTVRLPLRKFGAPGVFTVTVGGATATITPQAFDELPKVFDDFAFVEMALSSPVTLTAGVPVDVELTGITGGTNPDRWESVSLGTALTAGIYPPLTYGGATLTQRVNEVDVPTNDIPVTLAVPAPMVTGFAITNGFEQLHPAVAGCPQPAARFNSLGYTSLCWEPVPIVSGSPAITGAPLMTGFCAWQVQRRDDWSTDWRQIAQITDQNITCFFDYEARIGVSTDYRVRVCRRDGICGDWLQVDNFVRAGPSEAVTPPLVTGGCDGLVLTSNEKPQATLAYPYSFEGTPIENFLFVESQSVTYQQLHMRDYQVALRPLERGGVQFTRTLLINALTTPWPALDDGFEALRDLAWDSLTYVCVLDTRGGRWYASVQVPDGVVRDPNHIYLATVVVTETTDVPSIIDVGSVL